MSSPIRRMDDDDDQPSDRAPSWLSGRRNVPEPERQADFVGPAFSGDRAMLQLNRQLLRTSADLVPEPPLEADESGPENQWSMMWRLFSLIGIAAAIAWGIVLLPTLRKPATVTSQTDSRQAPNEASPVQLADAGATTGYPPPAQNGPTVDQPRVVALIPITKPPAATTPNDSPSAALPATPVAKSVPAAASPPTTSLPRVALTTAAAATPVAATSTAPQSNPVRLNSVPSATSPSPQPNPDLAAQAAAPAPPQRAASITPSTPSEPPAASVHSGPALAPDSGEITMLLSRGKDFLASGDLSSAQLLFRRAAEAGSAEAALNLASTYDPHYLAEHNVVGVMGNEEKARAWYQRAIDLGSAEASRRLAELGNK
jgi:hypothetical protein